MSKYCSGCGNPIPEGQGNSCSMCYGDISYGRDGYYQKWYDEAMASEYNRQMEEEAQERYESENP